MNMKFWISVADTTVEVTTLSSYPKEYCKDYLIPKADCPANIVVDIQEKDIAEMRKNDEVAMCDSGFLEALCIQEKLTLPFVKKGCFLMHGAVIEYNNEGLMFTAPSGTGKTTHIRLWRKYLGSAVQIVNGDKPFLSKDKNGKIYVWGTPWAGKERWQRNCSVPLKAICVIAQGTENKIRKLTADEAIDALFLQIYHKNDAELEICTLEFMDALLRTVPVYKIECDMSENAVKSSFEAMTGTKYPHCDQEKQRM